MSGSCQTCQEFLGAGQSKYCANCLPKVATRCGQCKVRFEPDGETLCRCCRNTEGLFPEIPRVARKRKTKKEQQQRGL